MNVIYNLMLTTGCNMIQWVLDRNPAPQNNARLDALRAQLDSTGNPLKDSVNANQPTTTGG